MHLINQTLIYYSVLNALLLSRQDPNLIIEGDFNTTQCPLLDKSSMTNIQRFPYLEGPISISDHAPITLTLRGLTPQTRTRFWSFPSYLSKSDDFKQQWANYGDDNLPHIDETPLFWATSKPVLRDHIINYVSFKRREATTHFYTLHHALLQAPL